MTSTKYISGIIHNSNLIEGFDDPEVDKQSIKAYRWLLKQERLTDEVVCKLQQKITKHQSDLAPKYRGKYRKVNVTVGGHLCMAPSEIQRVMACWIYNVNNDAYPTSKAAHIAFEKIHPFADGNGRTGRMLMWWQEVRDGKVPTPILFEDRQNYYKWFK